MTHYQKFLMDARRWVVMGQVAPPEALTTRLLLLLLFRHLPLRAMAWFRFGSWCKERRIPAVVTLIEHHLYRKYGLQITVGAAIGGGLYIAHPVGCVIAPRQMGENCSVIAAATIGMRNTWEFPTFGDEVFIGAGARVLGGITVGAGAKIGANAVVMSDVPAGATVVGVPGRLREARSAALVGRG